MNIYGLNGLEAPAKDKQVQSTFSESGKTVSAPFGGNCIYNAEPVLNAKDGETVCYGIKDVSGIGQKDAKDPNMLVGEGASEADALISVEDNLSDEDCERLSAEGDILSEYTEEALLRALNRVKLARALNIERIERTVEAQHQSKENIEKVAKNASYSTPKEKLIAEKLIEADLPVSDERIKEVEEALDLWKSISGTNADAGAYLINNDLQPSIENVYKAKYSGEPKRNAVSTEIWDKMRASVESVVTAAGLEPDKAVMDMAKDMLELNIPLTPENLILKQHLAKIDTLTAENVLDLVIDASRHEMHAASALLTTAYVNVEKTVEDFAAITDEAVQNAVNTAAESNIPIITLAQLKYAAEQTGTAAGAGLIQKNAGQTEIAQADETQAAKSTSYSNFGITGTAKDALLIKTRRQIEEIRLKLTVDAGYALVKQGIQPDIAALEDIVEGLKALEQRYYKELLMETGAAPTAENLSAIQNVSESMNSLAAAPAYVLGITYSERSVIQVNDLAAQGSTLTARFVSANQSYEAVMTKPRSDMGDFIQKAFANSDSLLEEIGMEANEANRRAIRILGYNNMEISEESINGMKAYDSHVNTMLNAMKPHVVSRMIKEGYNPLEHTVGEVIEKAESLIDEDIVNEERYSAYLVQLERSKAISEEERAAYISIYRALYRIEASDGAAIGAVVRNNEDVTMKNLIKAVRSSKAKGMDRKIDDEFGLYYGELAEDILREMTPGRLKNIEQKTGSDVLDMSPERLKEHLYENTEQSADEEIYKEEQAEAIRASARQFKTEGELLRQLGISDSMNMKAAMQELMQSGNFYRKIQRLGTDTTDNTDSTDTTSSTATPSILSELTDNIDDGGIIGTSDTLAELDTKYQKVLEAAQSLLEAAYEAENITSDDLAMLRTINQGIRLRSELVRQRYYEIPIDMDGELGCLKLTLRNSDESSGAIDIQIPLETGNVQISIKAEAGNLSYMISTENPDDLQGVQDAIEPEKERLREMAQSSLEDDRIETEKLYNMSKIIITAVYSFQKIRGGNK